MVDDAGEGTSEVTSASVSFDKRRMLVSTVIAMIVFTGVVGLLGWLFREPLLEVGHWFVDELGGPGIAFGYYLPDAFTIPMPNDAFTAFGLWGGMSFWTVVAWGSLGSILGGSTGWAIGRYVIARNDRVQGFMQRRGGDEMVAELRRSGRWFLALAAVSPIPYSITCWACGVTRMPYSEFLVISLLRIPRVASFLWLIELGFDFVG